MDENKFFKLVWRFNGVLISVAGILAIGLLLFVFYKLFQDVTRERTTRNIVSVEENAEIKENWKLGSVSKVDGYPILMVPLHSDQNFNRAYYSKSSNSTRNFLFVNTQTSAKKWLFDHTNFLIESSEKLRNGGYESKEPVKAILYQLVKLDSDNDKRLSASDLTTVAITKPDGTEYKEVLSGLEQFIGSSLISKHELFLMYQRNGVSYSANINLVSFELKNEAELPTVGL